MKVVTKGTRSFAWLRVAGVVWVLVVGVPWGGLHAQALEGDRQEEAEEFQASRDLFLRQEKLIFRRGDLLAEFSTLYTTNTTRILDVEQKSRRWDNAVNLQYGLLDRLQLGLQMPVFVNVLQESNRIVTGESARREHRGIGDLSGNVRYQLVGEGYGWPDLIADANVKTRTAGRTLRGSGHWNVGGGLTLVKTFDPVVAFARVGYTETLARGRIDPGDLIEYRFGFGFSLNDRVSLNTQLSGALVTRSREDNTGIRRTSREIASVLLATTILLDRHLSIEPVIGAGLTADAADFTFGVRLPYRF